MAKDRREGGRAQESTVSKKQFLIRIGVLAAVVIIAVITLVVALAASRPSVPTDGTPAEPSVTSTTVAQAVTTPSETATTTVAPSEATTATTQPSPIQTEKDAVLLQLINPWNPISNEDIESQPVVHYSDGFYVHEEAIDSLRALINAGAEYGFYVASSYRTYEYQASAYENKVQRVINATGMSREDALVEAATVVARPGTSEHHTGLAIDFLHEDCHELEEYWDQSPAFTWMMEHCAEYGFILRYPKDSLDITGVIYEPWHYRYVGVDAAKEIMSRGITLEEYLGQA